MTTGNGDLSNAADPRLTKVKRLKGRAREVQSTTSFQPRAAFWRVKRGAACDHTGTAFSQHALGRAEAERQGWGGRLPGEASPAKEAKEGQHNNDDDDDPEPGHVALS
jgi:hypothetical protein